MPGGDGTGPLGKGPLTGRGAGHCRGGDPTGKAGGFAPMGLGLGGRLAGRIWGGRGRGIRDRRFSSSQPWWACWRRFGR
ncbi:MAG: DUF5320 domain-containing protein [Gaiellales bacterium]|nr:DUF5320 domain-containing protein [Gaiellales bacterium]